MGEVAMVIGHKDRRDDTKEETIYSSRENKRHHHGASNTLGSGGGKGKEKKKEEKKKVLSFLTYFSWKTPHDGEEIVFCHVPTSQNRFFVGRFDISTMT